MGNSNLESIAMMGKSLNRLAETVNAKRAENRYNEIGKALYQLGDYSPETLKQFATDNNIKASEMPAVMKIASQFEDYRNARDPLLDISITNDDGSKTRKTIRQSVLAGTGMKIAPAETDVYYDQTTGRPVKVGRNQPIPENTNTAQGLTTIANAESNRIKAQAAADEDNQAAAVGRINFAVKALGGDEDAMAQVDKNGNVEHFDGIPFLQQKLDSGTDQEKVIARAALNQANLLFGTGMTYTGDRRSTGLLNVGAFTGGNTEPQAQGDEVSMQFKQVQARRPGTTWEDIQETASKYGITEAEVLQKILSSQR